MTRRPLTALLIGLLCSGCVRRGQESMRLPPPLAVTSPVPAAPSRLDIHVCAVDDGVAQHVSARCDPATGDTLLGSEHSHWGPLDTVAYARDKQWYVSNAPVYHRGQSYLRTALPRLLQPTEIELVGEYDGI